MRNTTSRAIIAGLAALSLAASAVETVQPASAAGPAFHGGGGHGGGGHGGGGGWHGGAGGWRGGGWHGGGGGWHGGGWAGPAVVGGLAAGALLAAPYAYGYNNGCYQYQPIYDAYGNYIGQQPVRVC
jgi:hypothetical protein